MMRICLALTSLQTLAFSDAGFGCDRLALKNVLGRENALRKVREARWRIRAPVSAVANEFC